MSKLQRGIESLYSAASLTDELKDEEAQSLLKWGEVMAAQLDTDDTDDDTYDEQMKQVRRVMKRANRFIGAQGQGDADEARKNLEKLMESAAELGVEIPQEQADKLMNAPRAQSNSETIGELVAMLSGKAASAAEAEPPVEADGEGTAASTMGTLLAGLRGKAASVAGDTDDNPALPDPTEGKDNE